MTINGALIFAGATTMETKEIQHRLQEAMAKLYPDSHIRFISDDHTILEDLDALDICVTYFLFDRDAAIREAIDFGKGGTNVT
jgi:hypothetical protein